MVVVKGKDKQSFKVKKGKLKQVWKLLVFKSKYVTYGFEDDNGKYFRRMQDLCPYYQRSMSQHLSKEYPTND